MTDKDKLERIKKLADGMYYAAQYLTTDASRLRKSMDEYQKFIVYEYNKQEPISEDLERAAKQAEQREGNLINGRFKAGFKSGAQWQKAQMMKDAIDTRIDKRLADMIGYTGSEKVKVIIIKE